MGNTDMTRRTFGKIMGAAGALSIAGVGIAGCAPSGEKEAKEADFPDASAGSKKLEASIDVVSGELAINPDVIVRHSACLGCYCSCGNRVRIDRASGHVLPEKETPRLRSAREASAPGTHTRSRRVSPRR